MFASAAIQTPVESFPLHAMNSHQRPKSEPPRVGGVRRLGEILPLVMARLDEVADVKPETAGVANDLVIAVRLSPGEMPYSLV